MKLLSTLLEVLGAVVVAAGFWVLAPWAGLIAGGLLCAAFGLLVEFVSGRH